MSKIKLYYRACPEFTFRKEGNEALLFSQETGSIEILNETGIFVYKLCNGKCTQEDIIAASFKKYNGSKKAIKSDIKAFLKGMIRTNIIKVAK